jgi:hypothetical protein
MTNRELDSDDEIMDNQYWRDVHKKMKQQVFYGVGGNDNAKSE